MKQLLKLFSAHIIIFIISILGLTNFYGYTGEGIFQTIYSLFHLLVVFILYIISGYLLTDRTKKFQIKHYWIIAFIGILIWLLALLNSPNDLDWKNGKAGIEWLVYRMYISGIETPFNFNNNLSFWSKNSNINIIILLLFSIIPSSLQLLGGFLKIRKKIS